MILKNKQQLEIKSLAKKYKLKLVLLFGSQARDEARPDSDVDIAVEFIGQPNMKSELAILAHLNKIFKKEVDISIINHANPLFLHRICRDAKLLSGTEQDFFNLRLKAFHRYNDYLPYLKMEKDLNKIIIKKYANRS